MSNQTHDLYRCRVVHERRFPVRYSFSYRMFHLLLDIDHLDDLNHLRLLKHNRFGLFSFRDADHGPRDGSGLRAWIDALLGEHGIDLAGGRVRLLAIPRLLGYGFNPISIWYCEHADGSLRAVLCEVNNTFGEHHFYLLAKDGEPMDWHEPHHKAKVFHVSPMMAMGSEYRFRLRRPDDKLAVCINSWFPPQGAAGKQLMLVATLDGQREALTDRALLGQFLRMPLMTFKVVAAIHWQALKIWLKGGKFYRDPGPPAARVS